MPVPRSEVIGKALVAEIDRLVEGVAASSSPAARAAVTKELKSEFRTGRQFERADVLKLIQRALARAEGPEARDALAALVGEVLDREF